MSKLVRRELATMLAGMPSPAPLERRIDADAQLEDLFLCALGFEPRCLSIPSALGSLGYRAHQAVYCQYSTNRADNAANLSTLEASLRKASSSVTTFEADSPDFLSRLRSLLTTLAAHRPGHTPRISFDVSVASNRLLVRCIKVLLEFDVRLRILYSEAAVYHPTQEEFDSRPDLWGADASVGLEQGVSEVSVSAEHPGNHLDPLPDCVILFPSFKAERSRAVISWVDPSLLQIAGRSVRWLLGVPHLEANRWRLEAMRSLNRIGAEAPRYEVSTFDYRDTMRVLDTIYREVEFNRKITVAPIGSKMQAVGIALFCHMHPDVRVVFAVPKEYNAARYSEGCMAMWQIDLGPLGDLRALLGAVGTLSIQD